MKPKHSPALKIGTRVLPWRILTALALGGFGLHALAQTVNVNFGVASSAAGSPFPCDTSLYQVRSSNTAASLLKLTIGGAASSVWTSNAAVGLNGLAFNRADGYQYAFRINPITGDPRDLFKLGSTGPVLAGQLTYSTGGAFDLTNAFTITGATFDATGRMFFVGQAAGNLAPGAIYRVDSLADSDPGTPGVQIAVSATYALSTTVPNVGDFAFGPDGNLYGATGSSVYQFALSSGAATVAQRSIPNVGGIGSAYFDLSNNFYVYQNGNETLYNVQFSFGSGFATDPVNSNQTSVIPFSGTPTLPSGIGASDGASCVKPTVNASGKVWNDANGGVTQDGSETGTNAGDLTVYAVDSSGKVIAKATVASDGMYTLYGLPQNASVTLRLSSDPTITLGNPAPTASSLPSGWTNTGENLNGTAETNTPGDIAVTTGTADLSNQDFGIEQRPTANAVNASSQVNPGGTTQFTVPALGGTDPEDGTLGAGSTITISSLPTNATLYYDGTPVMVGQVISGYDPSKLTLDPNDGALTATFDYTVRDAAGKDSAPATVSMPFSNLPPEAANVTNASMPSSAGVTTISGLSASDPDGSVISYTVLSLPSAAQGVLYMADGTTPVNIGQVLTPAEAASLKFDPSGTTNGDVTFTFTATDNNNVADPSPATYTIPVSNEPPTASNVTAPSLPSSSGPTSIPGLVGTDTDGTVASYTVSSLPDPALGVLLMSDGVTPVALGQVLTPTEAASLKFDPSGTAHGDATFTFSVTDDDAATSASPATYTIPITNTPPIATDVSNPSLSSTDGPSPISPLAASDPDGTVVSYTISSLPDPAQGVLYMADGVTPVALGQVLTPAEASGLKFDPGGAFVGDVTFTFTATDNDSAVDTTPATFTIPVQPGITIAGTVWDDADANQALNGTEAGTNTGGLYAVLTDSSGTVLQVVPVGGNGAYSFAGVMPNTDVKVLVSSTQPSVGSNFTASNLPSGWTNTTPTALSFNTGISSISGKDFGLNQMPTATGSSVLAQINPLGSVNVPVPSSAFAGTDLDGTVTTYTITQFPTNTDSITINGTPYTAGSFPPGGVSVTANPDGSLPANAISIDPQDGAVVVTIPFTVTDNASNTSAPATVSVPFNTVPISGKVWDDADGNQTQNGSEAGTNAGGLYAVLTDSSGIVLAVVPVNADGTFLIPAAPNNTDVKVLVSSTQPGIGSTFTAASLPSGWTNTTPTALSFSTGTTPITGKDFGVDKLPDTSNATSSTMANPGGSNTVPVPVLVGSDLEDGALGAGNTFVIVTLPINGTLFYDGTPVIAGQIINGYDPSKLTFDPNDDILTSSFAVAAVDAADKPDPTPATVTLNFKPVAKPDSDTTPAETPIKIPVLANDSSTLTNITGTTAPAHGSVTVNPDGTITYTPNPGWSGPDSFTYTACDASTPVECSTTTVDVLVTPTAAPDTASTPQNNPVVILVLENDKGKLNPASITIPTPPAHGSLSINPDGTIQFTPNLDYTGPDSFTYQVCDQSTPVQCRTATVTLDVSPNIPPVAQDKLEPEVSNNVTLPLAPLAATDADGTISSYTVLTLPTSAQGVLYQGDPASGGTPVTLNQVLTPAQASSLFFKPNPSFGGQASFTFTATDNYGAKDTTPATVRIPVNAIPETEHDTANTPLGTPVTLKVLENDVDSDGTLDLTTIDLEPNTPGIDTTKTVPGQGTFTVNANGTVTFTPEPNFAGSSTIPYSVRDNKGARSNYSNITVNVEAGQVTGHVFNDLDGNGLQGSDEAALVGLTVTITPEGKPSFTVTTDANGNYEALVPPGQATANITDPSNTRLTTANDPQTVSVTNGAVVPTTAVGFQPLEGNLQGRVFNDTNGNGAQDANEPGIGDVSVTITDALGRVFNVKTDSSGDYRVPNAAAGPAKIQVTDPAGLVLTTNNNPQTVTVKAGLSVAAPFTGYAKPSLGVGKRALASEVSVGGTLEYEVRVTNTSVVAVREITVTDELPVGLAYKVGSSKLGGTALEPTISVKNGRQVLTWVLPAELAAGKEAVLRFATTVTPNAGAKLENTASVNGVSGATASPVGTGLVKSAVAATVVKLATFTDKSVLVGRVYFDRDQDRNFDPSQDEPLTGARVYLSDGRYAITDAQGRYSFADLEPGEHVVRLDPLTAPYRAESVPEDHGLRGTRMVIARGGLLTANFPLVAPGAEVLKVRSTTVQRGPVLLEKQLVEGGAGYAVQITIKLDAAVQDLRLIDPLPNGATRGDVQLVRDGQVIAVTVAPDSTIVIPGVLEAGTYELRYAIFSNLNADQIITDPSIRYTEVIR